MEISVYSLIAVCNAAKNLLTDGASILTITFLGGERIVPGYNLMGVCKAALAASMKYLAFDLGSRGIRVNALSAGPLPVMGSYAANVIPLTHVYSQVAPLQRVVTHEEVGRTGGLLLSTMSDGITAETVHVDGGYSEMGSPGRMLAKFNA
jgi:enoyl-[acyl-carrier protein] reductase I